MWKNLNLLAKPLPDIAEAKKEVKILASEEIIAGVKTFVQVRLSVSGCGGQFYKEFY